MNDWHFTGEIFFIKPHEGEFAVSLRVRGTSSRVDAMSTQICEISCLGQEPVFRKMREDGIDVYTQAALTGHIETWTDRKGNSKIMLIVDAVSKV